MSGTLGVLGLRAPMPAVVAAGSGTCSVSYVLPCRFPPSVYHVSPAVQAQYRGQYILTAHAQRLPLDSGTISITTEPDGSLLGPVQFFGYDTSEGQTNWLAVLYNFQPLAHNDMSIQLFDTAGQYLHERMLVSRDGHGNLTCQYLVDGQRYAMSWRKVSNDAR